MVRFGSGLFVVAFLAGFGPQVVHAATQEQCWAEIHAMNAQTDESDVANARYKQTKSQEDLCTMLRAARAGLLQKKKVSNVCRSFVGDRADADMQKANADLKTVDALLHTCKRKKTRA